MVLFSAPPAHWGYIEKRAEGFELVYGGSMVFFVWQAILIIVESLVGKWEIFKIMGRRLPAPVRTALIVCAGIPVRVLYLTCCCFFFHLLFLSCHADCQMLTPVVTFFVNSLLTISSSRWFEATIFITARWVYL